MEWGRISYPEEFSWWLAYKRPLVIVIKFHDPVVTCDWEDRKERWHHEPNLQFRIRAGWVRLVCRAMNVAPFTIDPSLIQDINGLVLLESVSRTRIRASFGLERWWHGSNFVPSPGIPCQVDILHHMKVLVSSHNYGIHLNKLKFLVDWSQMEIGFWIKWEYILKSAQTACECEKRLLNRLSSIHHFLGLCYANRDVMYKTFSALMKPIPQMVGT